MNSDNHPDGELLALEAKLVDEYTAMDAKRGMTDDEINEWTARLDVLELQFAEMPVHTLDGVAAKLRRAEVLAGTGFIGVWGGQLAKTALASVERLIARAS